MKFHIVKSPYEDVLIEFWIKFEEYFFRLNLQLIADFEILLALKKIILSEPKFSKPCIELSDIVGI